MNNPDEQNDYHVMWVMAITKHQSEERRSYLLIRDWVALSHSKIAEHQMRKEN